MRVRLRRRTSATARVHGGDQRPAERRRSQLRRPNRTRGRRSHWLEAVHPIRGHGVFEQREGLEYRPRSRLRGNGPQP